MSTVLQRPIHFRSESHTELDLGAFRVIDATFQGPQLMNPHYHERPTLGIFLHGRMDKTFEFSHAEVETATMFTMPAGERHVDLFPTPSARTLVLEPDLSDNGVSDLFHPIRHLFGEIQVRRNSEIFGFARRIANELEHQDEFTPVSVSGLGFELFAAAARIKQPLGTRGREVPRWLRDAQEFLHTHFADKIQVADVANVVNIHPVHLSRMFREHTGLPVGAYIRKVRLDWAAGQLATSKAPITEIAIEAGFSDQSHFTRVFRRAYGMTPGQYRKVIRS